jgi:hypothetical protein
MDNQFIGRRGEKRFDTLCSDANVTCNKSVEDDYGWDKLIEFPPRHFPFAAIDMQPGRTIACVQVKTTTGAALSTTISLSNAMHYARVPIPQFIVLVVLDGTHVRYFAKHVWTELIARWLKAGRRNGFADGIAYSVRQFCGSISMFAQISRIAAADREWRWCQSPPFSPE